VGQDERYYDTQKLNKIFAIVSLILLSAVGGLFLHDYMREWKNYQREFRSLEIEKTRVAYDIENQKLQNDPEYQDLIGQIQQSQQAYNQQCTSLSQTVQQTINRLSSERDVADQRFRTLKSELDVAKFHYEEIQAHSSKNQGNLKQAEDAYLKLQEQVDALQQKMDKTHLAIKQEQAKLDTCSQNLKELERKKRMLAGRAQILERKLERIDPNEMDFTNRMADMIRDLPVIDLSSPNFKVEQVVLKEITDDVNFMRVPKVDRCLTCHQGIADPAYRQAGQPFRAHPRLDLFLAKDSPHPVEEFGCTVCHNGRGRGTDFVSAAHTPRSEEQAKQWEETYGWHELHHWQTPMYPVQYTQAGCFKCHSQETNIKGADKLNFGLALIEKAGCYSCHSIDRYKSWPKPGPDLTHLASKVSKEWTVRWIKDPQSFHHRTWMPSFFGQSNNSKPEDIKRTDQEIRAIVHYLFAESTPYDLPKIDAWGNAENGKQLVASVGCLGCHQFDPQPTGHIRTTTSLLQEQGPNLAGLGSKTSKVWIYDWIRDPNRYHPASRMPNLRLNEQEAADIAAYLVENKNPDFSKQIVPSPEDRIIDQILIESFRQSSTLEQARQQVSQMNPEIKYHEAGKKLIAQYGCYSCHNIKGFEDSKPIGTELTEEGSKAVDKLDFGYIDIPHTPQAWFTAKLKDPRVFDQDKIKTPEEKLRMPNYYFSDQEVEAIVTALLGFVKDRPAPSKMKPATVQNQYIQAGREIVRQFNCQGCHVIEGDGGVIQGKVVEWLVNYDNRSEGEAQAIVKSFSPPDLMGEGKKVRAEWLFDFLHQPTTIRPWLKVRMPTYHLETQQLNALVKYFAALDHVDFPFSEKVDTRLTTAEHEAAQKLFSDDYFGCAKCHIVGDQMPGGSPDSWAPNFALAKSRLKPEWITEWLLNPQELLPGTKMPTYFDPQYLSESGPADILNGDENEQIRVLRNYLLMLSGPAAE
jgi:cbb3-type cytochrome oxidase cytochrome c subunit/predicted  nucleic acid-binding Zn-ribbon protein